MSYIKGAQPPHNCSQHYCYTLKSKKTTFVVIRSMYTLIATDSLFFHSLPDGILQSLHILIAEKLHRLFLQLIVQLSIRPNLNNKQINGLLASVNCSTKPCWLDRQNLDPKICINFLCSFIYLTRNLYCYIWF